MKSKILVTLVIMLITINTVLGIGVSPPRILAEHMTRNSHFEKQIYLSGINGGEEVNIDIEGEISDWITVDRGTTFIFPEGAKSIPLVFSIDVPSNAPNGQYSATARIVTKPAKRTETKGMIASVVSGVVIDITADVTGEQIKDYKITSITIPNSEIDSPIYIILNIENKGNIIAKPSMLHIVILDKFNTKILLSEDVTDIPGVKTHTAGRSIATIEHNLPKEQYWGSIQVYDEEKIIYDDKMVFEILEKGSLKKEGILRQIDIPKQINKGEIVKIAALFENTGELPISAKFLGEIYKEGALLEVVKSEPMSFQRSETNSLIVYFTPDREGSYTIQGYVNYADKKTDVKEASFHVREAKTNFAGIGTVVVIIIAIIIAFLFFYKEKLKR